MNSLSELLERRETLTVEKNFVQTELQQFKENLGSAEPSVEQREEMEKLQNQIRHLDMQLSYLPGPGLLFTRSVPAGVPYTIWGLTTCLKGHIYQIQFDTNDERDAYQHAHPHVEFYNTPYYNIK